MASPQQHTIQLGVLTVKPELRPDDRPPLDDVCSRLQAVPGVSALYRGRHAERPDRWTLAVRWAEPAALDAFLHSPSYTGWLASLRAVADSYLFYRAPALRGDALAALAAPCTEVFSAYGAAQSFLDDRMTPFADNVDAGRLPGYRGSAYGRFDRLLHHGSLASPDGIVVVILIGWDSKDAHMAQRGEGKLIDQHIHYVREDRESVDLYHVSLTKL
ncbi:Dimeric alpha-beta barrel [Hirsutella rhossiliensis]|uniref:Dimeric alpha-beta barrel n=1 Tax=Hirsutella rhossiliensis TaxID=111463 RepID=A0A9P8SMW6_9HYPO|nr:Dimeric alpha-beta barrel [Hirsutella rhossiliensis]KAH0967295.1 Dimeric alpha-beta barrel [Hirsutella rhossiliensis]